MKCSGIERVATIERSKEFTAERFREGILSVIDSTESRKRKDGRLVSFCRWIDEKRGECGF